jgi:hypothetical protein
MATHKHSGGVIRHSPEPRHGSQPTNRLDGGTHSGSYVRGGQMDQNTTGQTGAGNAPTGPVGGNPVLPNEFMPR